MVRYNGKAKTAIVPAWVTRIGESAFGGWCSSLSSISLYAQKPPAVDGDLKLPGNTIVYVSAGSLNAYKKDSSWKRYGDSLRALP
ncbi:MAG: hypothetical protein LBC51_09890 [Treponema sp.]|nr:hypothetical protein [Treponema sp.]